MFHKCEKCGEDYAEKLKLIGDYHTYLCVSCQNKFTEFMFGKELVKLKIEWKKLEIRIELDKNKAKRINNVDDFARYFGIWENEVLRIEEIYTKLYKISKDWCQKNEKKD